MLARMGGNQKSPTRPVGMQKGAVALEDSLAVPQKVTH